MITYEEIIEGLISANIKNMPSGAILFYKNYEIDTEITAGMTLKDVISDIKRQIYETEKVPKDELPDAQVEPLSAIAYKVNRLKECISTNRAHINKSAETVSDKSFMLEQMSYNLDTKIDDIIGYIEDMLDKWESGKIESKTIGNNCSCTSTAMINACQKFDICFAEKLERELNNVKDNRI